MRPFTLNAALSLELLFKAILTHDKVRAPSGKAGHDLVALSKAAQLDLSAEQILTLELLASGLYWAARYPTPNNPSDWGNYHDTILERHKVRTKIGNVSIIRANPDTFPTWENYARIWNMALARVDGWDEPRNNESYLPA